MARRWPAVVLVCALLLFGVVALVLHREPAESNPTQAATGLGGCSPLNAPAGAAGYAAALASFQDPHFVGADVGLSLRLQDNRVVWMYGDTTRRVGDKEGTVRNSMVIDEGNCRRLLLPVGGGAAIPDRADGTGYWPTAMIASPGTLYVAAQRVQQAGNDLGFVNLGPAIAIFDLEPGAVPVLRSVMDISPDDSSRTRIGWGAAIADGGDGWWYVYGTRHPAATEAFGWEVRVARTRADRILDVHRWQYWDGRGWSRHAEGSVPVIAAEGGVSQTFSVVHRGSEAANSAGADGSAEPSGSPTWYAVSKRDGDLGTDLAVWPASAPQGPFADAVTVGVVPHESPVVRYMPLAHPDLVPADARSIVVSVSRNSLDPLLLARDPLLYRPFFVDITLPPLPSDRWLDPRPSG